ncbi:PspA/IM30 family protein [Marinobacter zhejiangensis]|uniref:Phage shock protein A (PspA) family protein n=1 Tax=Marinobacter zhejiangensis TaxID=488535 RepID=A0A1I4Q9D5_9GAMM|nr:PspA/IM30 family protein [Marinobacter zhejiangensis]SFM36654.1 phage shock protein A (PspA) family protein [Marinobacter zhejiangensis]
MMIWRKVGTLFRASAHEPVERLVDANALRILAQELRETEHAMVLAKRELANLMAESKQLERSSNHLENTIALRESQARQALEKGQDALALELAERIAEDQNLLQEQRQHGERLATQEKSLRTQLQDAARMLQHYKREMSLAKANENANQVMRQLGSQTVGLKAHMGELETSLTRIKERQTRVADVSDALQELDREASGGDLDDKLQQAGIATDKQDARSVLERLKQEPGAAQS